MYKVPLKTPAQIEIMAEGGRILAEIIGVLAGLTRIGATAEFLEKKSRELIEIAGAEPAFLNYRPAGSRTPYPASLCVSINDGVVHGWPSSYSFKNGDLVKLDLGIKYRGFYVDMAITVGVGRISAGVQRLIDATKQALNLAVNQVRVGKNLGDIGWAVEKHAVENGFSVIKNLTGHGIGRELHEEPAVYNYGAPKTGLKLKAGMVLAIEPMVSLGSGEIKQLKDDSFVTADGSLAAHFEHTAAVTEKGPLILTKI